MSEHANESLGESREALLTRVRAALGRSPGEDVVEARPVIDDAIARRASQTDDLVALFMKCAQEVGMEVYQCTQDTFALRLSGALEMLEAKLVVVEDGLEELGVHELLDQHKASRIDWHDLGMDGQYDADLGITGVSAALAETGTLIVEASSNSSRGLSLIPEQHLAILRASEILPDMLDFWRSRSGIRGRDLPSSVAFITGPSKTADIEGELITGVHGPSRVVILLIEDA